MLVLHASFRFPKSDQGTRKSTLSQALAKPQFEIPWIDVNLPTEFMQGNNDTNRVDDIFRWKIEFSQWLVKEMDMSCWLNISHL